MSEIKNVKVSRTEKHNKKEPNPGHVFYKFSFERGDEKCSGVVQISLAYESKAGVDAVKKYIEKTYAA